MSHNRHADSDPQLSPVRDARDSKKIKEASYRSDPAIARQTSATTTLALDIVLAAATTATFSAAIATSQGQDPPAAPPGQCGSHKATARVVATGVVAAPGTPSHRVQQSRPQYPRGPKQQPQTVKRPADLLA
jgi:hypothetical protein